MPRTAKLPTPSIKEQIARRSAWNSVRSVDEADFFVAGYQGRSIDEILSTLRRAGVATLVDIRYNPVSMYRPEVSKSNLERAASEAGVSYLHIREWGVPTEVRHEATDSGTMDGIWRWYDTNVVDYWFNRNVDRFMNLHHPIALMCTECDPTSCHRHRAALALESRGLRCYDL